MLSPPKKKKKKKKKKKLPIIHFFVNVKLTYVFSHLYF